jgi:Rod binding domain-containing protein
VDQGSEDLNDTREVTMHTQTENSAVNLPAIPSYFQSLFTSMIASMRAGNLELASKFENSKELLYSSVE